MPSKRPEVVLVNRCVVFDDEKKKILIIKRSKNDSYASEKWEFPGGKLDQGQNLSNALEREVLEEIGLFVIPTSRMVYIESQMILQGPYQGLPHIVIVGKGKRVGGKVKLSKEHEDYKWVDPNNLPNFEYKDHVKKS